MALLARGSPLATACHQRDTPATDVRSPRCRLGVGASAPAEVVPHRPTGTGHELTISGIGDNFQLHTLIAATLLGDPPHGVISGVPPRAEWVAAASDGADLQPADPIRGQFNLVDGHGQWIWHEGRPVDVPHLDGRRVIVLDPPPYGRSWNTGRVYPLMRPTVTLDRVMPPAEAAHWLSGVAPAAHPS